MRFIWNPLSLLPVACQLELQSQKPEAQLNVEADTHPYSGWEEVLMCVCSMYVEYILLAEGSIQYLAG